MKIAKLYLISILALNNGLSFSMDGKTELLANQSDNTNADSASNILNEASMPEELAKHCRAWIAENKELLEEVIPLRESISLKPIDIISAHSKFTTKLANHGNASTWNAALPIEFDGKKYFVKFAGPVNLAYTNLHSQKDSQGNYYGWHQLPDFPTDLKPVRTYQTISQAAHSAILNRAIEQNHIQDKFFVPKTWLVRFRGNKSDLPSDENCFIIQEAALDFEPVRDRNTKTISPRLQSISKETFAAAIIAIKGGTLWDIGSNLQVHKQADQFAQTDLEQPNNENAENFFQKNEAKRQHNVITGLEGFAFLCRDALKEGIVVKTQCEYFKELLLKDPEFGNNDQLRKAVNY
ncbi:hypothetical protein HYX58_05425 [Candidatus Dependentiae bacterium]|nr:hypothetical protein [Candidatus Dependentiae bacterium]